VDWGQARTFAKWVGADLPTEAEWEYAARGGQSFTYAGSNSPDDVAWYSSNSDDGTQPVGTKRANGYGLHDMSGNVWEWVLDELTIDYSNAPSDGHQAVGSLPTCSTKCDNGAAGRVNRGGGWNSGAGSLRVALRDSASPDNRYDSLGLRLRRTLP
jgi:formylglycine-generating enzyme required for sulfatase activity